MIRISMPSCSAPRSPGPWTVRRSAVLVVGVLLLGLAPGPAAATPDTLRRGLGNIMMGPFDMALSPIQGIYTVARNLKEIDDSPGVRLAFAIPGWGWLTMVNFGGGMIRTLTGTLEIIPGVILFASEADMDPLFDPVEDAGALFEWDNPLIDVENPWVYYNPLVAPFAIRVKMGINYTRPEY